MIVAAALRFDHIILSIPKPARHHDILHGVPECLKEYDLEQGFVTDKGEFLSREEAMAHCMVNGQELTRRLKKLAADASTYDGPKLFSEDLW